jgi:hypothetical protein
MASEDTLIGNDLVFMLGDDSSPPNYTDLCAVFDFGAVGEEKNLIDVTSLCDDARTYRNGLADGVEIPLQLNFLPDDPQAQALKDAYDNDTVVNFRIARKSGSPAITFDFAAIVRAWNVTGPIGARAVLQFTVKVSGGVTWSTT